MTEDQIRSWLKNQYPNSRTWRLRVDTMSYEQAVAIYLRMQGVEVQVEPRREVHPNQLQLDLS